MKKNIFWNEKVNKSIVIKPKKISKDARDLIKLGVGVAVAGAALGLGLSAYNSTKDGGS